MAMKDVVEEIQDDLKESGQNAGKAFDNMKSELAVMENEGSTADQVEKAQTNLIAAMAKLWLSGVQYNARAAQAPGKILTELADNK